MLGKPADLVMRRRRQSGGRGSVYLLTADLNHALTGLDALDFQVYLHAIGDRAVRMGAGRRRGRAGGERTARQSSPHRACAADRPPPTYLVPRAEQTATLQTHWAQHEPQMDDLTVPVLGPERAAQQYPFADLHGRARN